MKTSRRELFGLLAGATTQRLLPSPVVHTVPFRQDIVYRAVYRADTVVWYSGYETLSYRLEPN